MARHDPLICRILRHFHLQKCHFDHVGIEGEQGIYRCHCGSEFLGLKYPIVIPPGETTIRIVATFDEQ